MNKSEATKCLLHKLDTYAMIKRTSERINASNHHQKKKKEKEGKRRELNRFKLNNSTEKKRNTRSKRMLIIEQWSAQKNKNRQAPNKTFHWFILVVVVVHALPMWFESYLYIENDFYLECVFLFFRCNTFMIIGMTNHNRITILDDLKLWAMRCVAELIFFLL